MEINCTETLVGLFTSAKDCTTAFIEGDEDHAPEVAYRCRCTSLKIMTGRKILWKL